MLSHSCSESEDDRAIVLIACWATVVMMRRQSGRVCVSGTSRLCSPSEILNMAVDWADVGGVVERTIAWLSQFRRLRVRYEKRADIHEAFLSLGCALICWRFLAPRMTLSHKQALPNQAVAIKNLRAR